MGNQYMKFTELSDYPLRGGDVTEWLPRTSTGTVEWAADARPLTYDHELHIFRAAVGDTETSWLGAVFEIDRPLDRTAMGQALLAWTRRHEAFRTTVTVASDASGTPHLIRRTCAAERISIDERTIGYVPERDIHPTLTRIFEERLSPLHWPHCTIATIVDAPGPGGPPDSFLLVFAADHAVMDAYSMLLSINEIRHLYDAACEGRASSLPPIGSHVDFSTGHRHSAADLTADHPAVATWRTFLERSGGRFPALGLSVDDSANPTTATAQSGLAVPVATDAQIGALNTACRAVGHTTQSAMVACLAMAHTALSGDPVLRMAMPLHTRHEPQFRESVGWYVGIGPLEVDLSRADTFVDALAITAAAIADAKRLAQLPYPRIAELLGTQAEPEFVMSYLDLRFVPGAAEWPRWRAQTIRSERRSNSEVYLWVARTASGITISGRYPDNPVAHTNVHRLIATARAVAAGVVGRGVDSRVRASSPTAITNTPERQPA
ncbi:condensation domain-containing protein [Gordonia sinesedis]